MTEEEKKKDDEKAVPALTEETPVVTRHDTVIGGEAISYSATAGRMPLRDDKEEIEAQIFYVAYERDGTEDPADRPLMFVFNGGPGSASLWLHLGAVGPKRVKMQPEGFMPAPPYRLVENGHSWLDLADLVFIDPVGTGFSRAVDEDARKKHWGVEGDLEKVGEFIRLYLARSKRWASPLWLAGESYGTMRAAGLAGHLVERGIGLAGIVLISSVLSAQTLKFERGNDLPFAVFLPSYAAVAWYHDRLPDDLQSKPLDEVVEEAQSWAETEYVVALQKGTRLTPDEFGAAAERVARYTGLERAIVEEADLRIPMHRFGRELLRDEGRHVGRLDGRFEGPGARGLVEFPGFDPSLTAITPPYTSMLNDYVRRELGYETDLVYEPLSGEVGEGWEWPRGKYADTSEALRSALAKNPFTRVLICQGRYDLATPFAAIEHTIAHMDLDPAVRDNFRTTHYESGHMLYIEEASLDRLKADVAEFMG